MSQSTSHYWRWATVALAVSVVGCDSGQERVPVSGRVLIDGQPLKTGTVMVAPTNDRAAFGEIDSEGRFTLTTEEAGDGCVVGSHRATVTATEVPNPNELRLLIPPDYADLSKSELTVTVEGPTEDLLIELTWDGGGPMTIRNETAGDIDPGAM